MPDNRLTAATPFGTRLGRVPAPVYTGLAWDVHASEATQREALRGLPAREAAS